jgi:hypothetical protein
MIDLLKRLAEIEGKEFNPKIVVPEWSGYGYGDWNPLTNDAQAMALVKKYNVAVSRGYSRDGTTADWVAWALGSERGMEEASDSDLNTAICMAVVATTEDVQK